MKNHRTKFIKSVLNLHDLPKDRFPQIAFSGRSNVGKSSLINVILNQKSLVKISSTPGKTRSLNFFLIDDQFYLVDLPGYGFAKVSKNEKLRWRRLIEGYLSASENLKGTILIIDARIGFTELDRMMVSWLREIERPFRVVATKMDKLSRNEQTKQLKKINRWLDEIKTESAIPFSAKTKEGKTAVWKVLNAFMQHP